MGINDGYTYMSGVLKGYHVIKGVHLKYEIEMTTKKKPKVPWNDPDGMNKYTMYLIEVSTGRIYMKSEEQRGYNKLLWSEQQYNDFLDSLKEVD